MEAPLSKRLAAEVVGTFGFFFIAFCAIVTLATQGPTSIQPIGIAAGFGFALAAMIFALGHVSGGHYNPAVTAGLAGSGRFPAAEVVPYWVAQLVGGLLASLLIRVVFNRVVLKAVLTGPGRGVNNGKALTLEIVVTFLFILVVATVAIDPRAPWSGVFAPFAIGLFIFTAISSVGPLSGGSYNPARSLCPAIVTGDFNDVWIYIVGPLAGGALAGLAHRYFRMAAEPAPAD